MKYGAIPLIVVADAREKRGGVNMVQIQSLLKQSCDRAKGPIIAFSGASDQLDPIFWPKAKAA